MTKRNWKDYKASVQKKLITKYRLVVMNDSTFEEKLSFRLSRLNVFVLLSSSAFILVFLTVIIIAFTPLREYIPGYSNLEDRNTLYELSLKADSLENVLNATSGFMDSLIMVLSGNENMGKIDYSEISTYRAADGSGSSSGTGSGKVSAPVSFYQSLFYYKPVEGVVTQNFSPSMNHLGIDIVTPEESPVIAVRDGTVIMARWTLHFGNVLAIQHANNIISIYKHNSLLLKFEGDMVKGGEVVAISGNTGEITSGPHLHFELWMNGVPVNPALFLNY